MDARHIAFKHLPDGSYMTGEPLCYIIRVKDGPTCFFGGDTSLTYDMKLWGELFRPDVAFLGIGGVDLQGRSLDEMDPPAAAICAEMLGVKTVISVNILFIVFLLFEVDNGSQLYAGRDFNH